MTMQFSNGLMKAMGYEEHSPPVRLCCAFGILKIYSIQGINFANDDSVRTGVLTRNVTFGIGNILNSVCKAMIGDNFTEDEHKWIEEHKATQPLLLTFTSDRQKVTNDCTWVQSLSDRVLTYGSFGEEKRRLELLVAKWEVPAVLQLGASLTTTERLVKLLHRATEKVGRLDDGRWLTDILMTGRGELTTSKNMQLDEAWQIITDGTKNIPDTGERVPRLMHSAIAQRDNMKAFLFAWMSLEVLVNKSFDRVKITDFPGEGVPEKMTARVAKLYEDPARGRGVKTLGQKFAYMIVFAWPSLTCDDFDIFSGAKKSRDNFAHGDSIDYETLPTQPVLALLNKILSQLGRF